VGVIAEKGPVVLVLCQSEKHPSFECGGVTYDKKDLKTITSYKIPEKFVMLKESLVGASLPADVGVVPVQVALVAILDKTRP
jgi:hypothetical protein